MARRFRSDNWPKFRLTSGPAMIRDEDGQLAGYVFVDMAGRDIGSYVEEAKRKVAEQVKIPIGYTLAWSGQYEYHATGERTADLCRAAHFADIFVSYFTLTFKSVTKCVIVLLAVPFSMIGAIWFVYLWDTT